MLRVAEHQTPPAGRGQAGPGGAGLVKSGLDVMETSELGQYVTCGGSHSG
jgi:hypothetical protein